MITTYILVLCFSAWLIAYGFAQAAKRVRAAFGPAATVSPALCIALPMLAFLAVVAAPPTLLVAAFVLLITHVFIGERHFSIGKRIAVLLVAAALAATSVTLPVIANLPAAVLGGGAFVLLLGALFAADYFSPEAERMHAGLLIVWLPLLAAPFMGAPSYVALDIAIMASCLLAALMALPPATHVGSARGPFALMTAWLILESAAHGAWLPALASALAYGGAIAYDRTRPPRYEPFHAL